MDDIALTDTDGGGTAYRDFGIGAEGCVIIVRPDGHVAGVAPLEGIEVLKQFFDRTRNGI